MLVFPREVTFIRKGHNDMELAFFSLLPHSTDIMWGIG